MYNMKKERSYWEGTHAANRRIMYLAAGYEQEDIVKKPHIGIANTFFEGSPGTGHLRSLAESVKKGIWMNGGMPMEFGVPATCGNIATGSDGLRYELVLRDIVAMSIEAVVRVHKLDGLVILASCDNVIAGAYLAALRVHIPCIVVTGGIMGAGSYCGQALVQADVDVACTMQILGEALNLVLPGTSTIPAADNLKLRSCVRAGRFIVEQVRRGICPEDLMSREVLFNTVMLDLAIAGSTNAVLHLLAYSQELGLGLTLDDFDRIARRIKCLVGVVPSGRHTVIDLDRAGGVPAVMKRLETELYTGETTLLGNTWGEYLTGVQVPDDSIIHPLQAPFSDIAGIRILRGNLAEEGAVCRPTGVPGSMRAFSGRARVFDQEELAAEAVMRDEIQAGDVIVLRYEGPKGSPGMNELMKVTDRLIAKGMEQTVALITDGRFSGFNHGTIIGHVAPEAMAGGLIAFVEDGDIITYSIPEGILQLEVTEDVIAERKQRWKKPEPKIKSGVLALYGATCRPASEGAAMQNW